MNGMWDIRELAKRSGITQLRTSANVPFVASQHLHFKMRS
jgi:hypothetical protein